MAAIQGARARARAEVTSEIVAAARRQLAEVGPNELSLRAVARELGVASSAVYRYVAGRDELLTRLIVEAYDALGDAAEAAAAAAVAEGVPPPERWVRVALAVRSWAVAHPHEYALVYGTPVPDYEAPQDTAGPGTRVPRLLVAIVQDAFDLGLVEVPDGPDPDPAVVRDLAALRDELDLELPATVLVRTIAAWTQLFGLVSFELFSQTRGVVTDHEALFRATAAAMAHQIGLRAPVRRSRSRR